MLATSSVVSSINQTIYASSYNALLLSSLWVNKSNIVPLSILEINVNGNKGCVVFGDHNVVVTCHCGGGEFSSDTAYSEETLGDTPIGE
jgi:hypothetical protein